MKICWFFVEINVGIWVILLLLKSIETKAVVLSKASWVRADMRLPDRVRFCRLTRHFMSELEKVPDIWFKLKSSVVNVCLYWQTLDGKFWIREFMATILTTPFSWIFNDGSGKLKLLISCPWVHEIVRTAVSNRTNKNWDIHYPRPTVRRLHYWENY